MSKKALIAVGGNSLIRAGERGTIPEQLVNAQATARSILKMIAAGWKVVITHGNGPQVGAALLRSERASAEAYTHTLDMCVATTQSEIGYIIQQAMIHEMKLAKMDRQIITIPTMVRVDQNDKAFLNPSKPIGPFYTKSVALEKEKNLGWNVVEDASRGYRRVVASPEPLEVIEEDIIRKVIDLDIITIALGGGGIPVTVENGIITGSEAVIDKDRSSALLANRLNVDLFLISTDTDKVYLNFKKHNSQGIDKATVSDMEKWYDEGHFLPGSMGPKVQSVIRFLRNGGKRAIITSYEYLMDALDGRAGTLIVP